MLFKVTASQFGNKVEFIVGGDHIEDIKDALSLAHAEAERIFAWEGYPTDGKPKVSVKAIAAAEEND